MSQITVQRNLDGIEGLCLITPTVHGDSRGFFMETYNEREMQEAGIHLGFVQENQSRSMKGVLRGMHFQINYPQTKLVRVIRGEIYDVVIDLRQGSSTYGKWHAEYLSEDNKNIFLIPGGFAHGFLTLSDMADMCYKCNDFYHPNDEGGIAWNDPTLAIKWPQLVGEYRGSASAEGYTLTDGTPIIMSEKDQKLKNFNL